MKLDRIAILRFTPEFVLSAAKFNGQVNVENPIPADAEIVEIGQVDGVFVMKLRSASFDMVGPNDPIPVAKGPTFGAVRIEA